MPDYPIVDAHVHLYDPGVIRYGWMTGRAVLDQQRLMDQLDAARGSVEIEALVWVEVGADPGLYLQEASFVDSIARSDRRIRALVAHAPLERGAAVTPDLEKLAAHGLTRGIRRLLQDEPDDAFCLRAGFIEGVRLLARFGLSFDICVYQGQLANALELARRCPEVCFVLDHAGKPGIRDGVMEPWRRYITELAALPNVWCKLSGLITEADHRNWNREQLRPYIDHVIGSFGCARVMFGSDWPVAEETHRYGEWVEIVDQALAGAAEDERRKVFRDNAIAFYRLDAP
ncbi:MAG TPA: amidohydrolase family protein [Geminicoccaceae bacterium]